MRQFVSVLILLNVARAVEFTNPPAFSLSTDFSINPVYEAGSPLKIKWDKITQNNTSLTLWQLNGTQFLQPFEYLTQGISGSVTSLDWAVQTTKNLTFSSMFYLCLFLEGELSSIANSHYFNITSKDQDSILESSSTISVATITTGSIAASTGVPTTSIPTWTPTSTASTAVTPVSEVTASSQSSTELSSGTKAAIGIGVSVAVLGIVGFIWFCIRRRSKADSLRPKYIDPHLNYDGYGHPQRDIQLHDNKKLQVHELCSQTHKPITRFELPGNS